MSKQFLLKIMWWPYERYKYFMEWYFITFKRYNHLTKYNIFLKNGKSYMRISALDKDPLDFFMNWRKDQDNYYRNLEE